MYTHVPSTQLRKQTLQPLGCSLLSPAVTTCLNFEFIILSLCLETYYIGMHPWQHIYFYMVL